MSIQYIFSSITAAIVLTDSFFSYHPLRPFTGLYTFSYFIYDSLAYKLNADFLLHHSIICVLLATNFLYPYSDEVYSTFCRVEISTFAFNLIPFVNNPHKIKVQLVFFILFFKYRIYDLYYMFKENTFLYIQAIPLIIFYSLNLYWFVLICKKISKPLKNMNLSIVNHQICSYTMFINSMIIIYNIYPKLTYIQYLSGLLGLTSYLYHKEIANYYNGISTTIFSKYILYDITTMHMFHSVFVYSIDDLFGIVSCCVHCINVLYIYDYLPDDIISASIPAFAIDFIYLLYSTQSIELFTIVLLIGLVHKIKPCYDMTFASIQLLLIWYGYYLCQL